MPHLVRCRAAVALTLAAWAVALSWSTIAVASIVSVSVTGSGPLGVFEGREYVWLNAELEGVVDRDDGTTGHYRVPVSLNYPVSGSNSVGFLDVVNVADFVVWSDETAPLQRRRVHYTGDVIFSDYLRREGFTYLAVQWSRLVAEALGPDYALIENGSDGYQILADAATLLRTLPQTVSLPAQPSSVRYVIGHGHSLSAELLWDMVRSGAPTPGALPFEALLLTAPDPQLCSRLTDDPTPQAISGFPTVATYLEIVPCSRLLRDIRIAVIRTQTEAEWPLPVFHYDSPSLRVYDVAGVAHIPESHLDLRHAGATRQNPVSWRPVAKAILHSLTAWLTTNTEPPPSVFFSGQTAADGSLVLARDSDGNALGGIRLPHMTSTTAAGETAGAPLGIYGGFDLKLDISLGYAAYGGTFEPFDPTELVRRYPSHDVWIGLVTKAAQDLVEAGYILPEDFSAYVRAAEQIRW